MQAVWRQGRKKEAEGLIKEFFELTESSGSGEYAVYQEVQRKMALEILDELKTQR